MSIEEIKQVRLNKLEMLKDFGMDPYPAKSKKDFWLKDVKANFESIEKEGKDISLVGRVMVERICSII